MILADSSIWIDHFRKKDPFFRHLLDEIEVAMHPVVLGEIALGSLRDRRLILKEMGDMPQAIAADDEEVRLMIEAQAFYGTGIGYGDAHLLAATLLTPGLKLWTKHRRLRSQAEKIGVNFQSH